MKIIKKTAITIGLLSLAQISYAALYISPSARQNINIDSDFGNSSKITGSSIETGSFVMEKSNENKVQSHNIINDTEVKYSDFVSVDKIDSVDFVDGHIFTFGSNVPLFIALENIIPKNQYTIHLDDVIEENIVSWNGGSSWRDVLREISDNNGISIVINEREKSIGISNNIQHAETLAHKERMLWRLNSGLTLHDNLNRWAEQAGWTFERTVRFDYPINHDAVLTGDIKTVMDRLLLSFENREVPLGVVFHNGNKVIELVQGGHRNVGG